MKAIVHIVAILGIIGIIQSCKVELEQSPSDMKYEDTRLAEPDPNEEVSFATLSEKVLVKYNCTVCHGWANSEKEILKRVKIGAPFESRLFRIIENGSMPVGGSPVSTKDLEVLENYIKNFNTPEN